jgi:hypothetical protein
MLVLVLMDVVASGPWVRPCPAASPATPLAVAAATTTAATAAAAAARQARALGVPLLL